MNYIKITDNIFVVKNQNGFNNALYDFMKVDEGCFYSKQELRSMVTDFPKSYPAAVIFHKEYDIGRISTEVLNKNDVSAILECFEKFDAKIKDNGRIIPKDNVMNAKTETIQKNEHITTKCGYCCIVFEYDASELEEEEDRDMSGYHYYYYTKCPKCGNRILVNALM